MEFKDFKLDKSELGYNYVRSSGAGGQNVNKVATKAILSWNPSTSARLPIPVKRRFEARWKNRLTESGQLILSCDATRSQIQNKRIVTERLLDMIAQVWKAPKIRKKTKPSKASKEKRLNDKRSRSTRINARRLRPD